MTSIHLEADISNGLEIEALFQMIANRSVMTYSESNGHLLDDVKFPVFLFVTDYILSLDHFQNR